LTFPVKIRRRAIPTIAIIGGGTGGNLLAARLLERAADGQRLNVTLVEARGRAGPELRAVVRHAERMAPGAFLTRLRGEATALLPSANGGVRIVLSSGRVLEVEEAVVVTGSLAAAPLERDGQPVPDRVRLLPSEATLEQLREPVSLLADLLLSRSRPFARSAP
jgi:choline dehydrogenase-like flavoprotein